MSAARVTRRDLDLALARALAIYCPRCGSNKSGWEHDREERRHCFDCHHQWTNERLRILVGRTEVP